MVLHIDYDKIIYYVIATLSKNIASIQSILSVANKYFPGMLIPISKIAFGYFLQGFDVFGTVSQRYRRRSRGMSNVQSDLTIMTKDCDEEEAR